MVLPNEADENTPIVVDIPNMAVSEDASTVFMEFMNSDGSTQILRFHPKTMLHFLNTVFLMFLQHKMKQEQKIGLGYTLPIPAQTTFAQNDVSGKALLIGFRLQSDLRVVFAVSSSEASELYKQFEIAIKKMKRD